MEDLLREAAGKANGDTPTAGDLDSRINVGMEDYTIDMDAFKATRNGEATDLPSESPGVPKDVPSQPRGPTFGEPTGELIGLGLSESLPPFEIMEELYAPSLISLAPRSV